MLKLKLQYFGHLLQRTDSFEETLMLGKIEGGRRRGRQSMRCWVASPIQWTWVWVSSGNWWWTGRPGVLQSMGLQRVRHDWAMERTDLLTGHRQPEETCYVPSSQTSQFSQFSSVAQSCLTLCNPMDCSMPGIPVLHCLLEFADTHVHWVGDAI